MNLHNLLRLPSGRDRAGRCCRKGTAVRRHAHAFETLESRYLLDGNPTVLAHDPDGLTHDPVSAITLELSEAVAGDDARDAASYELVHLGADRAVGGGDDLPIEILPKYLDGGTQIEITTFTDLSAWSEADYAFPPGIHGDWQVEPDGTSVTQTADGGTAFFLSDFDLIGGQFVGRMVVEEAAGDDDFVGMVFGLQQHPITGKPDSYYLLSWKQAEQGTAEAGLKLAKITDTGLLLNPPDLWNLESSDPHIEILATGPAVGWQESVEYDFLVDYRSDGTIELEVFQATDGQMVWALQQVDAAPLGGGKVGFYNFSQPGVRYTNMNYLDGLADGYYQLTARSGEPGLRDLEGNALDGDGDGTGGDDFVTVFGIDTYVPTIDLVLQPESDSAAADSVTNVASPTFDVTVNKIGRIEIDFDGDAVADQSQFVSAPGTYALTTSYPADATYTVTAHFVAASGDAADAVLDVTVDTAAPQLLPGPVEAEAAWSQYELTFDEPIDAATFGPEDVVFTDHAGSPVAIDAVTGSGTDYTLTFPYQVAMGNYTFLIGPNVADIAGNPMSAAAEVIVALDPDVFGPEVANVDLTAATITVRYIDVGGIDADSVTDAANYALLASGGDGAFDNGNDVDLSSRIESIGFDPPSGVATLVFSDTLPDERYRLAINATAPGYVRDLAGNPLGGGVDYEVVLGLDTQPASVTVALQAGSDSGIPGDRVTNVTEPVFDVTINEAGLVEVDFDNDGTPDEVVLADSAGTHAFVAGPLADAAWVVRATLTPAVGTPDQHFLTVTVDTQPPVLLAGAAHEQAPAYGRDIGFNEPLVAGCVAAASVSVTGPQSTTVTGLTGSGSTYHVAFEPIVTAGVYTLEVGGAEDRAGNVAPTGSHDFTLMPDTTLPYVTAFSPLGPQNQDVSLLVVQFNEAMVPASFEPADVSLSGPGGPVDPASLSILPTGDRQFEIAAPTLTAEGTYSVSLARTITDLAGNPLRATYRASFTIDKMAPTVIDVSPAGIVLAPVGYVDLAFGEGIAATTLQAGDLVLTDPDGTPIAVTEVQPLGGNTYRARFAEQRANGTYHLTVGPQIEDTAGNPMAAAHEATFTLSLPDLWLDPADPETLSAPAVALFGETIGVQWKVDNAGTAAAAGPWSDRLWLSQDTLLDEDDILLGSEVGISPLAPASEYPASASVALPMVAGLPEGTYFLLVATDGDTAVAEADEQNNVGSRPIALSYPPLPDLTVSQIVAPSLAQPGMAIELSWTVANQGTAMASGPWREAVYLSSDEVLGDDLLVATFSYDGPLDSIDPPVVRTETITVPTVGASGELRFVVRVDTGSAVFELDEANNAAIGDAAMTVPTALTLLVPVTQVSENTSNPAILASVVRNGDLSDPLVVTLTSSNTAELTVPPTVTIPAGQTMRSFPIHVVHDGVVDGLQSVVIEASAAGAVSDVAGVVVTDVDRPSVYLEFDAPEVAEGGTVTGTVSRDLVTEEPLIVTLVSPDFRVLDVPIAVEIPAGQPSVTFQATAIDDALVRTTLVLSVGAATAGYIGDEAEISILDNDWPQLTLVLGTGSISEGAAGVAATATVTRDPVTTAELVVKLTSSDTSEARVPAEVRIPAGQNSTTFAITAVDDAEVDGPQTVTITARPTCYLGYPLETGWDAADLEVADNDGPTLSVVIARDLVAEGRVGATAVTVSRNTDTAGALTVDLLSSDVGELTVPAQVTIPAGQSSYTFDADTVEDGIADGNQTVAVTASVAGFTSGSDALIVSDIDLPDLVVEDLDAPLAVLTEAYFDATYRVANHGLATAVASNALGDFPGSWQERVFLSDDPIVGNDMLLATFEFTGTLPVELYFERTVSLRAPREPGAYWLVVTTDLDNMVVEGVESNNSRIIVQPMQVEAAYTATVQTDVDVSFTGSPVPLYGTAVKSDSGLPAAFELVNIHLNVRGTRRMIAALTNQFGEFSATFTPLPGEGGHYTVGAAHPGEATAPVQDDFLLLGMRAEPARPAVTVVGGVAESGRVTLHNLADVALTGLTVEVIDAPTNLEVTATLTGGDLLTGSGTLPLDYEITAADASVAQATVILRVSSAEGASLDVPVDVTVRELRSRLTTDAAPLRAAMLRGEQRSVEFHVTNEGGAPTGEIQVELPSIAWLSLATPSAMASLLPGQSATVTLLLTPPDDLALDEYAGNLVLRTGDGGLSVPFAFRCVSDAQGDLAVTVVDEYFYFTEEAPRVEDASVILRDAISGAEIARGLTDAEGGFSLTQLQEGYYTLEVRADSHDRYEELILVEAGRLNHELVFISRQTVQYVWTVEETEIQDRYRINVETVFETNVPAPVVTIDPPLVDLADMRQPGQTMQVDFTITNHGLIAAQNARLTFGSHPDYEISALIEDIGLLPAKSSLTIPVVITRIDKSASSLEEGGAGAKESSGQCTISGKVKWNYPCGEGQVNGDADVTMANADDGCEGGLISIGNWTAPDAAGGGGGQLRARGIKVECECKERWLGKKDLSAYLSPPVAAAQAAINAALASTMTSVELKVEAEGGAKICCDPDFGTGIEIRGSGTVETKLSVGPGFSVNCSGGIPLPDGGSISLSGSGFVGLEAYISGNITGLVTTGCNFRDPRIEASGSITVGFRAGIQGKISAKKEGPLLPTEYDLVGISGGLFGSVTVSETYSTSTGSRTCLKSDGVYLEAYVSAFGYQYSPYDNPGTPEFETKRYLIPPANVCNPAKDGSGGELDLETLQQQINEMLQAEFARLGMLDPVFSQATVEYSDDPTAILPAVPAALGDFGPICAAAPIDCGCGAGTSTTNTPAGSKEGVCARVRLSIDQEAVMTRSAFEAGLELINNSPTDTLTEVLVEVHVLDEDDNIADDLFSIGVPTLKNLGAVDGTGSLGAEQTGSASWLIVPTDQAAPDGPRQYKVGGLLRYQQGGLWVNVPLDSIPIVVRPDAALDLIYFHQRDVFADDPWTDEVEPSQPYSLAVMVQNHGAGAARNLTITSAQPEIIENEKGLLIDFDIIATRVAGENLTPSLTADFGDVAPGEIKIAEWLLKSTVQGQFVEYKATFEHLDGLGDPRLSLIKNVEIHELIHAVDAGADPAGGPTMPDFLVNDVEDPDDLPDTLYLSDGSIELVSVVAGRGYDGDVTPDDLVVGLWLEMAEGWNYARMTDPGGEDYRLVRVERADGGVLPLENFWQTDRTFDVPSHRPIDENKLHLFDAAAGDGTQAYTLFYQPRDQIGPRVIELEEPELVLVEPVDSLELTFSEAIGQSSFDWQDLSLSRGGGANLIHAGSGVTVEQLDETTYRVNGLAGLTAGDGQYTFVVHAGGVLDLFGNAGTGSQSATWTKLGDVPGVLAIDGVPSPLRNAPVTTIDVTFTKAVNPGTFGFEDLSLTLDGGPNLIDAGAALTFLQTSGLSFQIESLAALTAAEGGYRLTIDAFGVQDPQGGAGIGEGTVSWTMDATGPTVAAIHGIDGPATNVPQDALLVEFSEAIDSDTFDFNDLLLTLDGGANRITSAVQVDQIDGQTYRIMGLAALTSVDGAYELTVDAAGVEDLAGNDGQATAAASWTMDTVAPDPATNLAISPDAGISADDGRTNTVAVTLSGDLAESGLTVEVFDLTAGRDLGLAGVTGTGFSRSVNLVSSGTHRLRARALDAAGNYADSFFDVFVDVTPPVVVDAAVVYGALDGLPESIDVLFSEPVNLQSLIDGGSILSAVSLVSVEGGPVTLANDQLSYDAAARRLSLSLVGFAETLPDDVYQLQLDGSLLTDTAGNLLRGGTSGLVFFEFPEFAPGPNLQAEGADIDVGTYSVPSLADWNSDGLLDLVVGEKTPAGVGKVRVYLNTGTASIPVYGAPLYAQSQGADLVVSAAGCLGVFPRVFDFNRDGLQDLVLGLADGRVQVALNENTNADPQFGTPVNVQVGQPGAKVDINVGGRATLDLVDWNNDGRFDLVLGAMDGKVRVFLNQAASGPADLRGEIVVASGTGELVAPSGRSSVTVADLDGDGRKDLLLGTTDGRLLFYANTGTDAAPAFGGYQPLRTTGEVIDLAGDARSRPFVGDVNDDGIADLLVGAADGLVRLYAGQAARAWTELPGGDDGAPGGLYVYTGRVLYPAGITVTPTSGLTTTESGGEASFTVVLESRPTQNVTVALSSSDDTEGTVSPAGLTFTPDDWNLPQTVTVSGVDDAASDGHVGYTIVAAAAVSNDLNYSGLQPEDVAVVNRDNEPARILARHVFYNHSVWDGNHAGPNENDDDAIAIDKQALLPGQTATFANYTSYSRGINGIMIDVLALGGALSAADFEFAVGNSNDPDSWVPAPIPQSITLRPGAGTGGSDRVTIIWADYGVLKQWLQVTVAANQQTGLAEPDVFYFGNAVGDGGNSTSDAKVNATDMLLARNNPRTFLNPAPVDFAYDYNRDARVNATDMLLARNNQTHFLNALRLISVPGSKTEQSEKTITMAASKGIVGSPTVGPGRGEMLAAADAFTATVSAHDVVFAAASQQESAGWRGLENELARLFEFEQLSQSRSSARGTELADEAVDALLIGENS
ncbi:MAG: Ig-like domain-containing protein [Pirellulales bacterium]|nr:Ig-like domain-containing protein [Pirellulales bacterium]